MAKRKRKIRVMIADDHAILCAGLRMLVDAQVDMEVVSEASDGEKAIETARETKPGVALLDLTIPRAEDMKALEKVVRDCRKTRVLVLAMHYDLAYLRLALAASAAGYLLKWAVDAELIAAIRAVDLGGIFVDPCLANILVQDVLAKEKKMLLRRVGKYPYPPRVTSAHTSGARLNQFGNSETYICECEDRRNISLTSN